METIEVKYRTWHKGIPPRPTKLEIPGWAGDSRGHSNGDKPQPWHCLPFLEGATYPLELVYPFDAECVVTNLGGKVSFQGDFEPERPSDDPDWPPFKAFAPGHYGMTSSLDISPPEGYVIRTECHPRYFTDTTYSTPCMLPGHLQGEWWPRIFFVVFKAPPPGLPHIFRKGEPYGQLLIVPRKVVYDVKEMEYEEARLRAKMDATISSCRDLLAENIWTDNEGGGFDDKYKCLARVYQKGGYHAVEQHLNDARRRQVEELKKKMEAVNQYMKLIDKA